MNVNPLHRATRAGLGLAALLLLAGCAGGPGWGAWSQRPSNADMARVIANTEPVEPPPEPAPLSPPTRPMRTEVTFDKDK